MPNNFLSDLIGLEEEEPEFIDRARNPQNYPYVTNWDETGNPVSISTHRMAAEVDEKGDWYVFPTIVPQEDGTLREFIDDNRGAMAYNLPRGNFKKFSNMEEAIEYSKTGYKTEGMNKYDPLGLRKQLMGQ